MTRSDEGIRPLIRKVDLLMGKLKQIKNAALLRGQTSLLPERVNVTRWSSIYVSGSRNVDAYIKDHELKIEDLPLAVTDMIPTPRQNTEIIAIVDDLRKFESVSKLLQTGGSSQVNLYECRNIFDGLLRDFRPKYPLSALQKNSPIVNDPNFENGIAKLQAGEELDLTRSEKDAVRIYLRSDSDYCNNTEDDEAEVGYAEKILQSAQKLKKRKVEISKYRCTSHVVCTSNTCERLFSAAKLIISVLRKRMHPTTLNMLLFLKANRQLWPDASIFQSILNEYGDDDVTDDGSEDEYEETFN